MFGPLTAALAGLAADARAAGVRLVVMLALALVASLLAAGGTALLFAALYLWLVTRMPAPGAALLTALAVFVAAALLLLIGRSAAAPRRTRRGAALGAAPPGAVPADTRSPDATAPGLAAALGSEVGQASAAWLRGHAAQVVIGAAVAGFVIGVSPRLRRALWRLLD